MSFLDWPIEGKRSEGRNEERRRLIASELIALFGAAFPRITYQLIWDSPIVNAQAWRLGEARNVFLYGGLVRHTAIKKAGLALTLAHETGHHLGGEPRDPDMRWMTWQGQADYWAAHTGMPIVFGDRAAALTMRGAQEICAIERQLGNSGQLTNDLSPEIRCRIFKAGLYGEGLPPCAKAKYELLSCNR